MYFSWFKSRTNWQTTLFRFCAVTAKSPQLKLINQIDTNSATRVQAWFITTSWLKQILSILSHPKRLTLIVEPSSIPSFHFNKKKQDTQLDVLLRKSNFPFDCSPLRTHPTGHWCRTSISRTSSSSSRHRPSLCRWRSTSTALSVACETAATQSTSPSALRRRRLRRQRRESTHCRAARPERRQPASWWHAGRASPAPPSDGVLTERLRSRCASAYHRAGGRVGRQCCRPPACCPSPAE